MGDRALTISNCMKQFLSDFDRRSISLRPSSHRVRRIPPLSGPTSRTHHVPQDRQNRPERTPDRSIPNVIRCPVSPPANRPVPIAIKRPIIATTTTHWSTPLPLSATENSLHNWVNPFPNLFARHQPSVSARPRRNDQLQHPRA